MPLLETVGSSSLRGFGTVIGERPFILKPVYSTATLYAPLNDNSIYLSGSKSGSYFVTIDSDARFDTDTILNRKVLRNPTSGVDTISVDGKVGTKVDRSNININSVHSVSIWQRSRTGNSVGMLLSKFPDNEGTGYAPLDIWDGGSDGNIYGNIGDSQANPFSDGGTTQNWKSTSWTHWCFTFDGGTARMYRDGSFIGTTPTYRSFSTNAGNGSWAIGSWAGPYFGDYWLSDSNFADFAWFNGTALTAGQVANIYSAGVGF